MRFHGLARRILIAPALGLALAVAITACSSGSSSSSSSSSSAPATSSATSSTSSGGSAATVAAITANWEAFFSPSTSPAKKLDLLQNGQAFSSIVSSLSSGLGAEASAKVTSVTVTSPTQATVKYQVLLGGSPAPIPAQTGTAVYEDGTWKVSDGSLCALLALENNGKAPSVCSSAG